METLELSDRRRLEAAEGWLGLGSWEQAGKELAGISPDRCGHPDVLLVRWHVEAAEGRWVAAARLARELCTRAPQTMWGWVCLAHAAHRLGHTGEAREVLLAVVDEFPADYIIRYDLACYACQLGNLDEARDWLEQAIAMPHSQELARLAWQDANIEPLWRAVVRRQ